MKDWKFIIVMALICIGVFLYGFYFKLGVGTAYFELTINGVLK